MNREKTPVKLTYGKWFEITINPSDDYQGLTIDKRPKTQAKFRNENDFTTLISTYGRINNVKVKMGIIDNLFARYILYTEMSMPTQFNRSDKPIARVHYHGLIMWKTKEDLIKYLQYSHHRLAECASVRIDEYRGQEWLDYMYKDDLIPEEVALYTNVKRTKYPEYFPPVKNN